MEKRHLIIRFPGYSIILSLFCPPVFGYQQSSKQVAKTMHGFELHFYTHKFQWLWREFRCLVHLEKLPQFARNRDVGKWPLMCLCEILCWLHRDFFLKKLSDQFISDATTWGNYKFLISSIHAGSPRGTSWCGTTNWFLGRWPMEVPIWPTATSENSWHLWHQIWTWLH